MRRLSLAALLALALLLPALSASATVTYTYTGNTFDNIDDRPAIPGATFSTADFVTITLELPALLGPNFSGNVAGSLLSYTAFGGNVLLTETNSTPRNSNVTLHTDGSGEIVAWGMTFEQPLEGISSVGDAVHSGIAPGSNYDQASSNICIQGGVDICLAADGDFAGNDPGNLGAWVVPEPTTVLLLSASLLGLANIRRRRS